MNFDRIEPSSTKLKNVSFMTGATKAQNRQVSLLNDLEHSAHSCVLISEDASNREVEGPNEVTYYEMH